MSLWHSDRLEKTSGMAYACCDTARVGRLKPGITIPRAADSLQTIAAQFNAEVATLVRRKFPTMRAPKAQSLELTPGGKGLSELRLQFSQPLIILMSVVGLVLLIAIGQKTVRLPWMQI